MLSALLQAYVEEEFQEAARRVFPSLSAEAEAFTLYWNQVRGWGNPSNANIRNLFLKIGVPDIFSGLSWQGTTTADVADKLDVLNQLRNRIAHGSRSLTVNGGPYSLTLAKVITFRNLSEKFAERFSIHVQQLIPRP
jgi:RiboL-PSP-HEPN